MAREIPSQAYEKILEGMETARVLRDYDTADYWVTVYDLQDSPDLRNILSMYPRGEYWSSVGRTDRVTITLTRTRFTFRLPK